MKNALIVLTILNFFLFSACTKEESEFTDWPIIEAYLNPGDCFNLKITRQIPFSDGVTYSSDNINNLTIYVLVDDVSHSLTPFGDGLYADSSLIVEEGKQYTVSFIFNHKEVSAYTYIPIKPSDFTQSITEITLEKRDTTSGPPDMSSMPDPITLTWTNADASYYLILVENMETDLDPINDFKEGEDHPSNMFRKAPVTNAGAMINARDFQYFGMHRIVLFHVLPDYANLYNQSSVNSLNLTNPSSSIKNGYGILTGLNSDTLFINVIQE